MKKLALLISSLFIFSCGTNTNPTPLPTPSVSSSPVAVKYTREDYIRILTCTRAAILALPQPQFKLPENLREYSQVSAHLELAKNDTVWNNQSESARDNLYGTDVKTISVKYSSCK
jgi:hypothetical protein